VSLGASEYLWTRHGRVAGSLAPLDLGVERRVQAAVRTAVSAGLVTAAHDCSDGGLAVALAESCVTGPAQVGADVVVEARGRNDLVLFGEGPSRVIVSVDAPHTREFEALMAESAISWRWIGATGGDRLVLRRNGDVVVSVGLAEVDNAWRNGFERHMA
jgi:phosphoribosylformylglycinamidine synthase